MTSELPTSSDADKTQRLPSWPIPVGFLAYFSLFYYFANSGMTIPAMAFGFIGLPVFIFASLCSIFVLSRLALGGYKGRLSWFGLLAWLGVAALCVTMFVITVR